MKVALQVELAAPQLSAQPSSALLDPSRTTARRLRASSAVPGESPDSKLDRRMIDERHDAAASKDLGHGLPRRRGLAPRGAASGCRIRSLALVGYTNAGKSTLFNRLTGSREGHGGRSAVRDARSDHAPKLDASLGPQDRHSVGYGRIYFRSADRSLIAAFRATLEEVVSGADHRAPCSRYFASRIPICSSRRCGPSACCRDLGLDRGGLGPAGLIDVLNKIDLVEPE